MTSMDDELHLVTSYLRNLTTAWSAFNSGIPADVFDYAIHVKQLLEAAERRNEVDRVRAAIDYVLEHPDIDCGPLVSVSIPYNDKEGRRLLLYVQDYLRRRTPKTPPKTSP